MTEAMFELPSSTQKSFVVTKAYAKEQISKTNSLQ